MSNTQPQGREVVMDTTQPAGEIRLLECPFCGMPARLVHSDSMWWCECINERDCSTVQPVCNHADVATKTWNRRTANSTIEHQPTVDYVPMKAHLSVLEDASRECEARKAAEAKLATLQQENARLADELGRERNASRINDANLTGELAALMAELAALQPTGEVIDTIKRSLVSSESINDTYAWMKRVDAATKWISALEETT